jgi:hypothetical protein
MPESTTSYVILSADGMQSSDTPQEGAHADQVHVKLSGEEVHYQTTEDVGGVSYGIGRGGVLIVTAAGSSAPATVFGPTAWLWVSGSAAKIK